MPASESTAAITAGDMLKNLLEDENAQEVLDQEVTYTFTLGEALDALGVRETLMERKDEEINQPVTLGEITEFLVENEALQAHRDREFTFKATIGELLDFFGEENVKTVIEEKTADASYNPDYERTLDNVMGNWMMLVLFALAFAMLSTLSLEMIDRDKR